MFRRHRFTPAVQDLFGGDGMVEDSGSVGFNELERILRNMLANLSAHFGGDENRARLVLLNGIPRHRRRIFEALLARPRGRPRGDTSRASNNAALRTCRAQDLLRYEQTHQRQGRPTLSQRLLTALQTTFSATPLRASVR